MRKASISVSGPEPTRMQPPRIPSWAFRKTPKPTRGKNTSPAGRRAFKPWTNCRPGRGRCANEENARVFHQGPDTCVVHGEAGYINAALHWGSLRDTRRFSEG